MRGARQKCPDCGSPLDPCKCEREDEYISPPGAVANSTLGVRKGLKSGGRLRSRTLEERYGDDPIRYGVLFKAVREKICFGRLYVAGHSCGIGYAPASAHHIGDTDLDGQLPACGKMHDRLEEFPKEVEEELPGDWTLETLGKWYVRKAARELDRAGDLPDDVRQELEERGVEL